MLSIKDEEKRRNFIIKNSVKCECGHSIFFKRDFHFCTWCGRKVYKNKKTKFRYEMSKLLKNRK